MSVYVKTKKKKKEKEKRNEFYCLATFRSPYTKVSVSHTLFTVGFFHRVSLSFTKAALKLKTIWLSHVYVATLKRIEQKFARNASVRSCRSCPEKHNEDGTTNRSTAIKKRKIITQENQVTPPRRAPRLVRTQRAQVYKYLN